MLSMAPVHLLLWIRTDRGILIPRGVIRRNVGGGVLSSPAKMRDVTILIRLRRLGRTKERRMMRHWWLDRTILFARSTVRVRQM